MSTEKKDIDRFGKAYVLLLVGVISAIFLAMIWSFLHALLMAAILAGVTAPVYKRFVKWFGGRKALASATTILLLLILVLGPLSAFLGLVASQAFDISQKVIPWAKENLDENSMFAAEKWVTDKVPALEGVMPSRTDLMTDVADVVKEAGSHVAESATKMTAGTVAFFLNLFVMLYAMFFFLIGGRGILNTILYHSPLPQADEEQMLERFTSITRATIKGTMIIALIQGTLGGIAFWVAGIPGVAFWGTIMVVLSIIPGVGSTVVWLPTVIYLFLKGEVLTATLLTVWFAGVVGMVDNFLRPKLVGKDAGMPALLILLSTLGGMFMFGPTGFIIGPIVSGMFLTVWNIYGVTFKDSLPPVKFETDSDAPSLPQ